MAQVPVGSVKDPTGFYGGIPGGKYNVYGNFHQYKRVCRHGREPRSRCPVTSST